MDILRKAPDQVVPAWLEALLNNAHKFVDPIDLNTIRDSLGNPILHAFTRIQKSTLQLLQKHGLNIDLENNQGQTALQHACHAKEASFITVLLEAGADIHRVDRQSKL